MADKHIDVDASAGGGMGSFASAGSIFSFPQGDEHSRRLGGVGIDAVGQVEAEEKLRDSTAKYRTLIDAIDQGFLVIDVIFDADNRPVDLQCLEANAAAARLLGTNLTGKRLREIDPGYAEHCVEIFAQVAQTGQSVRTEDFSAPCKKWWSFYVFKIGGPDSRRIGTIFVDITERKQAEQALRSSRDRFELLARTEGRLLISPEPQKVIEELCNEVRIFLGCAVFFNFLVDRPAGRLRLNACGGVDPRIARKVERLELIESLCGSSAQGSCRVVAENLSASADPRAQLVRSLGIRAYACHPLLGANGEAFGTLSFGTDNRDAFSVDDLELMKTVADHVAASLLRQEAEEATRSAALFLEQNPSPVLRVDAGGRILFANTASAELLREWQWAVGAPVGVEMRDKVTAVLAAGKVEEWEASVGARVVSFVLMPIEDRGYVNLYGRDVTEQKRAETGLRESVERWRHAGQLVGLCPYSWEPATGALDWSDGIRELWGLAADTKVDFEVWRSGVHPDDWPMVQARVQASLDPRGDGTYKAEHRVRGADGVQRWIAVSGRTQFAEGKPVLHTGVAVDITERKRGEEAVRERAEELSALLDAAPVAVWLAHDPECRVITGNAYADELIMGTPRGGNISRSAPNGQAAVTYRAFRDGLELKPADLPAQQATATGKAVPAFEMELVFPNGRKLNLMAGAVPLFDGTGKVRGAIVAGLDVTPLKKAQDELARAEERARFALQAGSMGTWDRTIPDGPTVWNEDFYRILGYDPEQVDASKEAWESRVHPEDLQAFHASISGMLQHGGDFREEVRVVQPAGEVRWVELRGSIQCDPHGKPKRSFGVVMDFTERKRAEDAVRESEERFRTMANGTPLIIWVADANGNNRYVNRAYLEFFGVHAKAVEGQDWQPLVHPDDRAAYVEAILQATRERKPLRSQLRVRRHDGAWRWIESCAEPRFSASGEFLGMAGCCSDVTEQKEFQAELERLVAERTSELQELVGELEHFSYTITHDLKSPLRAMRGFAEIMSLNCGECQGTQAKEYLRRISGSAERMNRLIADALNYSRTVRQELPLNEVDADALLRGMLDSYPEFQAASARIELEGTLPVVLANQAGLTQCFSNLVGNAVKSVKPGQMPHIRIKASECDGWVRFSIEDNGIGISKEMLPRVFDMFARGSKDYEGTGIGLALVRKAVQRMGGRVGVQSEPGGGSRFWIELKCVEAKTGTVGKMPAAESRTFRGTVLYVEDEESDVMFMQLAFAAQGLAKSLYVAADGRVALDYLSGIGEYGDRKQYPVPNLVLLDLNLPQVPGFEVLKWMKTNPEYARTPVVVFSSSTRDEDCARANELGADDFLSKPSSGLKFGEVVEALRGKWLEGGGPPGTAS